MPHYESVVFLFFCFFFPQSNTSCAQLLNESAFSGIADTVDVVKLQSRMLFRIAEYASFFHHRNVDCILKKDCVRSTCLQWYTVSLIIFIQVFLPNSLKQTYSFSCFFLLRIEVRVVLAHYLPLALTACPFLQVMSDSGCLCDLFNI